MSVTLQSGYRWASVTSEDHGGALYIVTFLNFTYTTITCLTRLIIKWHMLGLDDGAMLVAQIANVIQFALLLASLSAGLAKSFNIITNNQYSRMASTYSGAQVVTYTSLGFSKIATILLVRRLFTRDMKNAWTICNVVIGGIVVWTLASAVLVSAGCSAESLSPKTASQTCSGIEVRYMFIVVTDAITDLVLAFIPTYLCCHLQMNVLFKLQVLEIFALRLPLLVLAAFFLKTWKSSLHSDDPGVARTTALVLQQSQLCFSLIVGTIPCIRSFIQSFDTGSGLKAGFGYTSNSGGYGYKSSVHYSTTTRVNNGESYQMSSLNRRKIGRARAREEVHGGRAVEVSKGPAIVNAVAVTGEYGVELERRNTQESDRKSQQSTEKLFIRKEVEWEVKREIASKRSDSNLPGFLRLSKRTPSQGSS